MSSGRVDRGSDDSLHHFHFYRNDRVGGLHVRCGSLYVGHGSSSKKCGILALTEFNPWPSNTFVMLYEI